MPSSVRRWPTASRGPPGPRHGATLQLRALEASEAVPLGSADEMCEHEAQKNVRKIGSQECHGEQLLSLLL